MAAPEEFVGRVFFGEPERAAEEECRKDAFSQAKRYAEHLNKALKEMLP